MPELDEKALRFSQKYSKSNTENSLLDQRKKAMILSRNVDRVSDILELPILLATAIASSSSSMSSSGSAPSGVNYSQALDLFAHIKHLQILHPDSAVIQSVLTEAEEAMKDMTCNLITALRGQNIRLAAAIRTIGWLRRLSPELATHGLPLPSGRSTQGSISSSVKTSIQATSEGSFGYLFLTCRLYNLLNMLEALTPLRDLADQERPQCLQDESSPRASKLVHDQRNAKTKPPAHGRSTITGQQTERYLKRYIEIFREQSFATVSMYKNIFPAAPVNNTSPEQADISTPVIRASVPSAAPLFLSLPTSLATFPSHLISLLTETLRQYLPNVTDPSARDSLLMQVLYAAGSLGRLGADFSMFISSLLDGDEEQDGEDDYEHAESCGHMVSDNPTEAETEENDSNDDKAAPLESQESRLDTEKRQKQGQTEKPIPEWIRVMKKHRLQSSRLEALASGQDQARFAPKRASSQETVVK